MAQNLLYPDMIESTPGIMQQICLSANAVQVDGTTAPLSAACGSKSQVFAEWLREALSALTGPSLDFSDPIQEDNDWDIQATCGHLQFCIEVSFLEANSLERSEWVITVLPDARFHLLESAPSKSDPKTVNLLCEIIRKVTEHRDNVVVLAGRDGHPSF